MLRQIYKSKIQHLIVTETNLKYVGSITIDKVLLEAADILPGERVQIVNINNGSRVETYVMIGKENSGTVCMNGGAARWAAVGDPLIIISYCLLNEDEIINFKPKIVFVSEKNKIKQIK
ncbi:MAG: aspartate 1-decarboxylase [Candidatus Omnitrophota bacterium]